LQAIVPEKHLSACPVGRRELARTPETEHFLVPCRAGVNVTDRQPEVVDAADHALLTVSFPAETALQMVEVSAPGAACPTE
jgi:hypothetical protein